MIQSTNVQAPCRPQRFERPAPVVHTDYNAVKIAINGASVNAPAMQPQTGYGISGQTVGSENYSSNGMPTYYD